MSSESSKAIYFISVASTLSGIHPQTIRTYEEKFKRRLKLENYIGAFLSKEYPELRKALLKHDKTYNTALDFIQNPPSDCEVIQLCPPTRLKSKRDSKNIDILKADYNLGQRVAENYLNNLEN